MSVQQYIFFLIFGPLILIGFFILYLLREEKYKYYRFAALCGILLIGHILLPYFDVGIFPHLKYDILFYFLLFLAGMIFTIVFIMRIEQKSFKEIGWESSNILRDIGIGILCSVILLLFSTILMLISQTFTLGEFNVTIEKLFTAIFFALGAIYEDCLFRGHFQKTLEKKYSTRKSVLIQALAFLLINLFYFPFDVSGIINYIVIFIMAVLIGFLAHKYSLYCANTTHVVFVLLAGLLI